MREAASRPRPHAGGPPRGPLHGDVACCSWTRTPPRPRTTYPGAWLEPGRPETRSHTRT